MSISIAPGVPKTKILCIVMVNKLWDKLGLWQKRLVIIVSIITSVTFLYPRVVNLKNQFIEYKDALTSLPVITNDVKNALEYIQVLNGILKAQMEKIEGEFYVTITDENEETKKVKADLRRANSKDIYIFVPDGKVNRYWN